MLVAARAHAVRRAPLLRYAPRGHGFTPNCPRGIDLAHVAQTAGRAAAYPRRLAGSFSGRENV